MSEKPVKNKLAQIILRIDDEYGHHVIRYHDPSPYKHPIWEYTIEGFWSKPESYALTRPAYYIPIPPEDVKKEFEKQGKEFRQ